MRSGRRPRPGAWAVVHQARIKLAAQPRGAQAGDVDRTRYDVPDSVPVTPTPRYRFAEFVISPRQRLLWRLGVPVAIIPKYFDLLHFLIRHRRDAVSKQAIFSEVWSDVIVSDGALSQAVRVLRRTLGDDAREPRFIRTVARHGYQFVWANTSEDVDDGPVADPPTDEPPPPALLATASDTASAGSVLDSLVTELLALSAEPATTDQARDVAERLHGLGTAEAMASLMSRPGHASALALMRDTRWAVAGAGPVPLPTGADGLATAAALIRLRLHDARRTVASRWAGAATAGAIGGALCGVGGGVALLLSPTSTAQPEAIVALSAIGVAAGTLGAAGIGVGLAAAEALARSRRALALAACGALAGTLVGSGAHLLLRVLLDSLAGLRLWSAGGMLEGLVLGAAAGSAYAWATPQPPGGGIAAPVGRRRLAVMATVGVGCALGAMLLAWLGHPLVGGLVHDIARSSRGGQLVLAPLGALVGEPGFGPLTQTLLGAFEGGGFGAALAWGLTRRPRP